MSQDEVEQRVDRDLEENWLPLLKTAGQWDGQKIRNELHDLVFIYHQVAEVYEYITNGKLSKPMYYAEVIKAEFDDAINAATTEAEARVRELEAGLSFLAKEDNWDYDDNNGIPIWIGGSDSVMDFARAALAGEA